MTQLDTLFSLSKYFSESAMGIYILGNGWVYPPKNMQQSLVIGLEMPVEYRLVVRDPIAKMAKRFDSLLNVFALTSEVRKCIVKKRLPELGLVLLLTALGEKGFPEHKRERSNDIVGNYRAPVELRS